MKLSTVAECGGAPSRSGSGDREREGSALKLPPGRLADLFDALRAAGYRVVGPTERNGSIVVDELASVRDLPVGRTLRQGPGSSRVEDRADDAYFGYANGAHSFKRYLFPPRLKLWSARRSGSSLKVEQEGEEPSRLAFFGARACDLEAIAIQDRIFLEGETIDPDYKRRRESVFVVSVNCTQPGELCFCESMGCGPEALAGWGISLTEISSPEDHWFLAKGRGSLGERILDTLCLAPATEAEVQRCSAALGEARERMGRSLETEGLPELLRRNFDSRRWETVAERCLACSNCTMVCPTCFCFTVEDTADLAGEVAERWRQWDSCFCNDFTYFSGGRARASTKSRYRQWLTHKLSRWIEQYDTFGCVGCGRCIVWCPVGIDITEEAAAIRAADCENEKG